MIRIFILFVLMPWIYGYRPHDRENVRKQLNIIEKCLNDKNNYKYNTANTREIIPSSSHMMNQTFSSWIGCVLCSMNDHSSSPSNSNAAVYGSNLRGSKSLSAMMMSSNSIQETNNKQAFELIYKDHIWGHEGGGSGAGSDPGMAFGAIYIIRLIMYKYGLTSILDAPCGAVSSSWTKELLHTIISEIPCFRYHGVDVVSPVIEANSKAFSSYTTWLSFSQADLSSSKTSLPTGYDMILSRDALQHLPYQYIAGAVKNYCKSDSSYLLVGSYIDRLDRNKDIVEPGGCFDINLLASPFNFPAPVEVFAEKSNAISSVAVVAVDPYPTKYLLLYHLPSLCQAPAVQAFVKSYA